MTTYVVRDGKLVEKHKAPPKGGAFFMPDIKPFISPIDGTEISSRSHLRSHEHKHGVRQVGDDYARPRSSNDD